MHVVKGSMTVVRPNNDACDKKLAFKNNAPFISCIAKISNTLFDNPDNLDIVIFLNTPKIIPRHQEAYGIIIQMNQTVVQYVI